MLNAAYSAVKAVAPRLLVVTAGTAPYGDPPGGNRVRPVEFWRQALCTSAGKKNRKKRKKRKGSAKRSAFKAQGCAGRAMFDVLAHHPINTTGGPAASRRATPNDASSPDLDRVARVLRAAERAGTVLPGRHPVWATEMWWDSNPPNSAGAPPGRQARWIEEALYLAWKDGASVVINLLIRDSPSGPHNALGGADSGIFFASGQPKPSYTAFRFPFVTDRIDKRTLRAWGKAPAGGKLVIQRKRRGAMACGEEAQGADGSGVHRKAPAAREAAAAGGGVGQQEPGLERSADRALSGLRRRARIRGVRSVIPRERHANEKGPDSRHGTDRLPGDRLGHGGDGENQEEEDHDDDHSWDHIHAPEPL